MGMTWATCSLAWNKERCHTHTHTVTHTHTHSATFRKFTSCLQVTHSISCTTYNQLHSRADRETDLCRSWKGGAKGYVLNWALKDAKDEQTQKWQWTTNLCEFYKHCCKFKSDNVVQVGGASFSVNGLYEPEIVKLMIQSGQISICTIPQS